MESVQGKSPDFQKEVASANGLRQTGNCNDPHLPETWKDVGIKGNLATGSHHLLKKLVYYLARRGCPWEKAKTTMKATLTIFLC